MAVLWLPRRRILISLFAFDLTGATTIQPMPNKRHRDHCASNAHQSHDSNVRWRFFAGSAFVRRSSTPAAHLGGSFLNQRQQAQKISKTATRPTCTAKRCQSRSHKGCGDLYARMMVSAGCAGSPYWGPYVGQTCIRYMQPRCCYMNTALCSTNRNDSPYDRMHRGIISKLPTAQSNLMDT